MNNDIDISALISVSRQGDDGVIDAEEAHLRALANDLYGWINGQ